MANVRRSRASCSEPRCLHAAVGERAHCVRRKLGRVSTHNRLIMSLTCAGVHKPGLLHVAFNQDGSCVVLGTAEGVRIFHIETHAQCYRNDMGAVGCAVWTILGRSRCTVGCLPCTAWHCLLRQGLVARLFAQCRRDAVCHQPAGVRGRRCFCKKNFIIAA